MAVTAVSVSLSKPFGLTLEENSQGVYIAGVTEGGSAFGRKAVSAGMGIKSVGGQDCSEMDFDAVMALLQAAESPVDLVLTTPAAEPATATATPSKAQKLEGAEKFEASLRKNFGSAQATQKTATKVTKTVLNTATWKNPIYFWSIAGTALLFVPIILYSISK